MIYYQCSKCGQIEIDTVWLIEKNKTCEHCRTSGEYELWPSIEIRKLFKSIQKYKSGAFEYGLVSSVFISAALELLLEKLLFTMAMEGLLYDEAGHLVDHLLDTNQGRSKRLQLYKRVGYGPFDKEAKEAGCSHFMKHWDEIAEIRNKCVHGDMKEGEKLKPPLVETTISEALNVFAKLHNKYNAEGISYSVAIEQMVSKNNKIKTKKR